MGLATMGRSSSKRGWRMTLSRGRRGKLNSKEVTYHQGEKWGLNGSRLSQVWLPDMVPDHGAAAGLDAF